MKKWKIYRFLIQTKNIYNLDVLLLPTMNADVAEETWREKA